MRLPLRVDRIPSGGSGWLTRLGRPAAGEVEDMLIRAGHCHDFNKLAFGRAEAEQITDATALAPAIGQCLCLDDRLSLVNRGLAKHLRGWQPRHLVDRHAHARHHTLLADCVFWNSGSASIRAANHRRSHRSLEANDHVMPPSSRLRSQSTFTWMIDVPSYIALRPRNACRTAIPGTRI